MSGLRDLLPTASGLGERGWDGFNSYRNVIASEAVVSWEQATAMRGRVFIKVYGIEPRCRELRAALNGGTPEVLRVPHGTFPELLMAGTFPEGRNTLTINTTCPTDTLRVYKLQAHPLAPLSPTTGAVLGASLVAGVLVALLAWGLRVGR
ncbi:hypothetical protein GCM10017782_27150 [Deinococcus ficus]|nr:hypothetical protein GCM10017782_27150 [Deinococcus ficus]